MKKTKTIIFVFLIFISSLFLRLSHLGKVPNGLTVDEADMAYNAFSVLQTGRDVYNRHWPLFFQSLDDYKPAIPVYLTIPSIKLMGISAFSIRLMPALLGSVTPLLAFFLFKLIYPRTNTPAAISAVLFTLAPWNIAISRATFMYIELVFFLLLFLITFLLSLNKNKYWIFVSAFLLGLTLYVYYAALIYLPFLLVSLSLIYKKDLLKVKKTVLMALVVLLIVCAPAFAHYLDPHAKTRFTKISIFTPDVALPISLAEIKADQEVQIPASGLIHNRRFVYINHFLANYFDYYNFDYLFTNANKVRYFYVNWVGLFNLIELPLFLVGLYVLVTKKQKEVLLFGSLLIIGPIPAAITSGSPFPHRGILLILAMQFLIVIGISRILGTITPRIKTITRASLLVIIGISTLFFMHQYFFHSRYEFSTENDNGAWFSSMSDVVPFVNRYSSQYQNVVFSWTNAKTVPPIYFLLYNQVDPRQMQQKASQWTNEPPSFRQIYNQVGNVEFRPIDWQTDQKLQNTLFVGYPEEFKGGKVNVIDRTVDYDGKTHFILVGNSNF